MIQINKKLLFKVMLLGSVTLSGCSKSFLNVNKNPNQVTDDNITPELIFPQAANAVGVRQVSFGFLNSWMGYFAANGSFVPQQDLISYNIDFSFSNATYGNHFSALYDLHQAEVKGLANGDTALAGASIVLATKLYQELVDLFGDIPYFQAFQSNTYPTPAYDKAQDIYKVLQLRLDTAIKYLGFPVKNAFAKADIVAGGNTSKWIKFANTLKLRLLIRQSEVSGFNPASEIAKIGTSANLLGAGESIAVNPGYSNDVNKQNPFYTIYGWDPTGVVTNTSTDANAYIVNILNGDPRLNQFFYPVGFKASGGYIGAVFGDLQANLPQPTGLSYYGPALVGGITAANVGDGSGAKQDQWIYPSYESLFLYAEAVTRGWFSGISASQAYQNAVTESFVWLQVPTASAAASTYLAAHTLPTGSAHDVAKFMALEKYKTLVGIDPLEAYSDLRRLGMLTDNSYISVAQTRISSTLPVRLPYPQTEYTSNSVNALKEGTINIFTSKLFWQP
jgi:SusD/RagB-like outer membrane lipoprotein